ncbi:hypothetical protein WA158_006748 [Blastocystis sp. Blastoise]
MSVSLSKSLLEMKNAICFTGQGSQFVGMGKQLIKEFPYSKFIYEQVDERLKRYLSKIILEGDESDLRDTQNTQPALLCHEAAILEILKKEYDFKPQLDSIKYLLGHSVGEIVALYASNALDLDDSASLLSFRASLISSVRNPSKDYGMLACLYPNKELINNEIKHINDNSTYTITLANINSPQQYVISGYRKGLELLQEKNINKKLFKKSIFLNVNCPFHSVLLDPIYTEFYNYIHEYIQFKDPIPSVFSNFSGLPMKTKEEIPLKLANQLNHPVLWQQCVEECIKDQVTTFIEIGPKPILSNLNKQINNKIITLSICDVEDIKRFQSLL